jgi:hypothetical protein
MGYGSLLLPPRVLMAGGKVRLNAVTADIPGEFRRARGAASSSSTFAFEDFRRSISLMFFTNPHGRRDEYANNRSR